MGNYYVEKGYSRLELGTLREELNRKVRELGELYENTANYTDLTPYQERAIELSRAG